MAKYFVVVEGQGDERAVPNLLNRLAPDLGFASATWEIIARRTPLFKESTISAHCEDLRRRDKCAGALIVLDNEDGCPKLDAPRIAAWVRAKSLSFPVAVVLFFREYETLFLASLPSLVGQPINDKNNRPLAPINAAATLATDPQSHRDAKAVLNGFLPPDRPYRETDHQLALTRYLDFPTLRASGLPCFGRPCA